MSETLGKTTVSGHVVPKKEMMSKALKNFDPRYWRNWLSTLYRPSSKGKESRPHQHPGVSEA
jgi:hypothetical protein